MSNLPKPLIHIGLPKTGSTFLQKSFQTSENLCFLGRGVTATMLDYLSPDIEIAAGIDLRFRRRANFDEEKFVNAFSHHLSNAAQQDRQVVLSSEFLGWSTPDEIDMYEKVRRLGLAFPNGANILMFIRDQQSLLRSLYKEMVRQGFRKTFQEFISWLWDKQDRNFFHCLNFAKTRAIYEQVFGAGSVFILPYEFLREDPSVISETLNNIIPEVSVNIEGGEASNQGFSDVRTSALRQLNCRYRHTLGRDYYSGWQDYFVPQYFSTELNSKVPVESLLDENIRRLLVKISETFDPSEEHRLDFHFPKKIESQLQKQFASFNDALSKALPFTLPSSYLATEASQC